MSTLPVKVDTSFLDMKAQRIRDLSISFAQNTVNIGLEFRQAREKFPETGDGKRPGWHDWIRQNTPWGPNHAIRFIRIAERLGPKLRGKNTKNLPVTSLQMLSQKGMTDEVIDEAIAKSETTRVGKRELEQIMAEKLPSPKEANRLAAEKPGSLVLASNGKYYTGVPEDEMIAYKKLRSQIFGVERAFDAIAACELTPRQWIENAEDSMLFEMSIPHIDRAIQFLTTLRPLLIKRQEKIENERPRQKAETAN